MNHLKLLVAMVSFGESFVIALCITFHIHFRGFTIFEMTTILFHFLLAARSQAECFFEKTD